MLNLYGDGIHDDTKAIQKLIDENVEVIMPVPKKHYLISKALEIPSNRRIVFPRFAEIRLAPMSDCSMIKNVTVEDKGERCPSRTYQFVNEFSGEKQHRVENIEIVGGIWNYDNQNQRENPILKRNYGPNGDYNGMAFVFYNVKNLRISSLTIKDPITYGVTLDRVDYFTIDNINFDYHDGNPCKINMDGIHLNGNCSFGYIKNLKGACFDDLIALNADEGSYGTIKNIEIDGIFADDCHSAVRLLTAGCELKNVHISNVFGTYYQYCIGLTRFYETKIRGVYDGISIDHIYASKAPRYPEYLKDKDPVYPLIFIEKNTIIKNLKISELHREERVNPISTVYVGENTVIENLVLEDIATENLTESEEMPVLLCEGCIEKLSATNIRENGKEVKLSGKI